MRELRVIFSLASILFILSCSKDEMLFDKQKGSEFSKKLGATLTPLSNSNISNVVIKSGPTYVQVTFDNALSKRVDIRYRKQGTTSWSKKYNVNSGFRITGLSEKASYDLQFSYEGERWSYGGFNTYKFNTLSNSNISNVFIKSGTTYVIVTFDNALSKSVDIRYRKQGTTSWTKVYDVNSGFKITGLSRETSYDLQFSYQGEWWSWGGYNTYKFNTLDPSSSYRTAYEANFDAKTHTFSYLKTYRTEERILYREASPGGVYGSWKSIEVSGGRLVWRKNKLPHQTYLYSSVIANLKPNTRYEFKSVNKYIHFRGKGNVTYYVQSYWATTEDIISWKNISNVVIKSGSTDVQVTFDNPLSKRVDIRYRKEWASSWTKIYDVNSGFKITGLSKATSYDLQFSYQGEWWSWGGYNTYKFNTLDPSYAYEHPAYEANFDTTNNTFSFLKTYRGEERILYREASPGGAYGSWKSVPVTGGRLVWRKNKLPHQTYFYSSVIANLKPNTRYEFKSVNKYIGFRGNVTHYVQSYWATTK